MAYTEAQLLEIDAAIIALATGKRAVRVTFNGRTVEYGLADLPQLRALRDDMSREISAGNSDKRGYTVVSTRKGL